MRAAELSTRPTLLRRVASLADHEAWTEFYTLYAPLLYRYARARGLCAVDAEEVRDACLGVLAAKLPKFRYDQERGRFRGFLETLVRGRVIDLLRRRRGSSLEELGADLHDPAPGPDQLFEARLREQSLLHHLEAVCREASARDERVLRLLLFEERDAAGVASELGLSVANVHQIKSRMLQRIRERCR